MVKNTSEYMRYHIFELRRKIDRVFYELTMLPAISWLDSSVGRALQGAEVMGFESRSRLNFFQALISQLLKLCITEMINHVFSYRTILTAYIMSVSR